VEKKEKNEKGKTEIGKGGKKVKIYNVEKKEKTKKKFSYSLF
jgi:hypothetical protein